MTAKMLDSQGINENEIELNDLRELIASSCSDYNDSLTLGDVNSWQVGDNEEHYQIVTIYEIIQNIFEKD